MPKLKRDDEIERILRVAMKFGYVESKVIDGVRKWRITEAGREFLENHRDFDEIIEVHEFCNGGTDGEEQDQDEK